MQYHYEFILATMAVLGILFLFTFFKTVLPIRRNRMFRWLLVAESVTLIFNVLSTWYNSSFGQVPLIVINTFDVLFFIGFVSRDFLFYCYIESLVQERAPSIRLPRFLVWTVVEVSLLLILTSPWSGIVYSINDSGYHIGRFYRLVLYTNAYSYLLFSIGIVLAAISRNVLARIERFSLIGACLILVVGNIMRMLYPTYLLMDSFYMISILVMYLSFQNPDLYIERKTGLLNQSAALSILQEFGKRETFSVFALVLDDFSENRRLYGVRQMDAGLRIIADYLRTRYPDCFIAYLEEGRFMLIARQVLPVTTMCRDFDRRLQEPWHDIHVSLYLTASYVAFCGPLQVERPDIFLNYVATALRRAEEENQLVIIDEQERQRADHDAKIRAAVDWAITNNTVEVYYQPLYGTKEQRIIGAEALSRIVDPELGMISPGEFIQVAERSGSITQLGEQVFEKVCAFLAHQDAVALGIEKINVNLSPIQCRDERMPERLLAIAGNHHIDLSRFKLEITESALADRNVLQNNMKRLQEQHAVFSLDDFGTGYSNLMRVLRFPFSDVKLDMSFVQAYFSRHNRLLPAIIDGFQSFGVQVTAEGVETREMARELTRLGCSILQGYYFSKPLPEKEFLAYVARTQHDPEHTIRF